MKYHKQDTEMQVFFYEQEFYVLSNFSAFQLYWKGQTFMTSEHAYHCEKFPGRESHIRHAIRSAPSAHEALQVARRHEMAVRSDWSLVRVDIMREILRAKVEQHEYVKRKLLETGERELIEDSWRDAFWGIGPNKDGQNMLGKLWMEIRAEIRKD